MGNVSCNPNTKLPELSATIEYKVHGSELPVYGKVIRAFRTTTVAHDGQARKRKRKMERKGTRMRRRKKKRMKKEQMKK